MSKSKSSLPESLRQQMSKAGRARAHTFTFEERAKGGRKSWENRMRKAREAEALAKQQARPRNIAPPTRGIF